MQTESTHNVFKCSLGDLLLLIKLNLHAMKRAMLFIVKIQYFIVKLAYFVPKCVYLTDTFCIFMADYPKLHIYLYI